MRQDSNTRQSIYRFLEETGVLQSGDAAQIEAAKALYYRNYKRQWRKAKRHAEKVFEITLDANEYSIIETAAKKHNMSKTAFIKAAALAYSRQQYIVPRLEVLYELKELLALNYDALQQMQEEGKANGALHIIAHLESTVLKLLFTPKLQSDGNRPGL